MTDQYHFVRGLLILIVGFLCIAWLAWRALKKSDDPGRLVSRWVLTLALLGMVVYTTFRIIGGGGMGGVFFGVPAAALLGILIAIIWAPTWASIIFKPLLSVFDGGEAEGEVTPQYSIVEAKRARGQFREAVAECRRQFELFPNDLKLQFLLAEIHAENLNDLRAAEMIIMRMVEQSHSPANVAAAYQQLADWQLKYGQDPDSARETLQRIVDRFPETPFAQTAAQRIAHMTSVDRLLQNHELPTVKMKEYERDLGLKLAVKEVGDVGVTPEQTSRTAELVEHLKQHPLDTGAREELARVYAFEYHHLQLALSEVEQLLALPQQKKRDVARWLELTADFYIKVGNDLPNAEAALHRVIQLFPDTASAEMAQRRLATLGQELKVHKKSQVIKLGSYEKDLGLKQKITAPPPAG